MHIIALTQNQHTIVDDIDSDLATYRWQYCQGYARRGYYNSDTKRTSYIHLHRVILARALGRDLLSNDYVDHINRNKLDNTRANLRLATYQHNAFNRAKRSDSTSHYKGIKYIPGNTLKPYAARIAINGKRVCLGYYATALEAAIAYDNAALSYFGNFAVLNFPKREE